MALKPIAVTQKLIAPKMQKQQLLQENLNIMFNIEVVYSPSACMKRKTKYQ